MATLPGWGDLDSDVIRDPVGWNKRHLIVKSRRSPYLLLINSSQGERNIQFALKFYF